MCILSFRRVPPVRPRPWSSRRWCEYFHRQWHRLLTIPWRRGAELKASERDLIALSLAEFQQGEGHEGGHFYRCARAYAKSCGDLECAEAHRLFMAEEKRHARDLARFLKLAGIPLLTKRSWLNQLFCWLGSRGGIQLAVAIVAHIEVVGQIYYGALRRATASTVLRQICAQILRDEQQHVRFQAERLALLRAGYWAPRLVLSRTFDFGLFLAAAVGLWWGHRHVLRAGGISGRCFWRQAWAKFRTFARQKNPRRYSTSAPETNLHHYLGVAHAQ
jgi:hypothetical protein